jgi:NADH-quinone oxidoreductase subunit N
MLAVILVVSSAISAAYYLTIVSAMFMRPRPEGQAIPGGSPLVRGLITTAAVLLLAFGVYPAPVARLSRLAATSGNTRPSAPERESVRTIPLSTASAGPTAR